MRSKEQVTGIPIPVPKIVTHKLYSHSFLFLSILNVRGKLFESIKALFKILKKLSCLTAAKQNTLR